MRVYVYAMVPLVACGGSKEVKDAGMPAPTPVDLVYAHSPDTLFKMDPRTKEVSTVGKLTGCPDLVTDMAVDANGDAFMTTFTLFCKCNLVNATCTQIASGSYPNALSFVPAGTLDPAQDALVGYFGSQYVRIDTTTGAITNVGMLQGGFQSSGDIVSVKGGGTYLTVIGNNCMDCLLEIDPRTGGMIKNWGSVQQASVYGLAYFAGTIYGFNTSGTLFEIKLQQDTLTSTIVPIPNAPPMLQFWGAGSSTVVPK